ncbi:MAG: DsbA family oxidoreductase [Pseudomonadota bacterium]|nr:DsbA family oxidoreductase [Pseudomonadota bacterium]
MDKLKIDIVSDVVCPWCVIGFINLQKAMTQLSPKVEFEINWKPYELHPEIPENGYDKKLYMQQRFGNLSGKASPYKQIEKIGKSLGFDFNFSKSERIPNTFNAHRLLWKAREFGIQTELSEALFKCYFTEGKDIGSREVLLEVATKVGMDSKMIQLFLDSKEGGQETADEEMNFIEKSIGAVPTYFINEKYIIQGGQEPETFVSFLNKILIKEKQNEVSG